MAARLPPSSFDTLPRSHRQPWRKFAAVNVRQIGIGRLGGSDDQVVARCGVDGPGTLAAAVIIAIGGAHRWTLSSGRKRQAGWLSCRSAGADARKVTSGENQPPSAFDDGLLLGGAGWVERLDAKIFGLAIPALAALCVEPLLSIVDTGFIGRLPNPALSLGGLAVATSIFDLIFRGYNFLCVVVVPLVAEAAVAQRRGDPTADPAQITGRFIGFAACLGAATSAALFVAAPAALEFAGAQPGTQLSEVAAVYLRIRAFALPASLVNTVAVGALRGQLDTVSPLQVVVAQSLANVVLDAVLVFGVDSLGIPALGVQGAAIATAISIWLACLYYCSLLTQRGQLRWDAAFSWPFALSELKPLIEGGSSQLARTILLQSVLVQFTRTVAGLDATGLAAAAHQVTIRTWFFALFALDSIAVAAQGLVPTAVATSGAKLARRISLRLLLWGFVGGVLSAAVLSVGAPVILAAFTDDAQVQATAMPLLLVVALLQPLAGLVFTWDGIFQGLSDYSYLASAMAVGTACTFGTLQYGSLSESLQGVWVCFTVFLLTRAAGLALRFWLPGGPLDDREVSPRQ